MFVIFVFVSVSSTRKGLVFVCICCELSNFEQEGKFMFWICLSELICIEIFSFIVSLSY